MVGKFVPPKFGLAAFTCPHCGTLAPQPSGDAGYLNGTWRSVHPLSMSVCGVCGGAGVWLTEERNVVTVEQAAEAIRNNTELTPRLETVHRLVYPAVSSAPNPNADLPDDIRADYVEASSVLVHSPRAAAALLRLCLQKLCIHFGEPGKDINQDIGRLVSTGKIRPMVQKAMDVVRIAGNESVHPGELNLDDDKELALALFDFVNLIADEALTQPKRVDEMFAKMPDNKRDGVVARDAPKP